MLPLVIVVALAADPPAKKELFAAQPWYKEQAGKEQTFTGQLVYKPLPAGTGVLGRYNAFTLEAASGRKKTFFEVYSGGKDDLLKPYANKTITLTGKRVDIEAIGTKHREIWPARLLVVAAKPAEPPAPAAKPIAVARFWSAFGSGMARDRGARVIASAGELAVAMGKPVGKKDDALSEARKHLGVKAIDFDKQQIVVVAAGRRTSGGYSVEITGLKKDGGTLVVQWKLNTPKPGSPVTNAITYPGIAALVAKSAKVKFDPELPLK
jgi:hypothetical protein